MEENYLIADQIVFDAKPDAVPFNYRISYKMGQICLIIEMCGGRKSLSLMQIQMIASAMNSERNKKSFLDFCLSNKNIIFTTVHFDPAVNRILKYAVVDGMIKQLVQGTFRLTDKGKKFVKEIKKDSALMKDEIAFLNQIGSKLTQEKISALIQTWRYIDASDKSN